jgi:hypothetical protein
VPRFVVEITEMLRARDRLHSERSPFARDVTWVGTADDRDAAAEAAHLAWERRYGSGREPIKPVVDIRQLDQAPTDRANR